MDALHRCCCSDSCCRKMKFQQKFEFLLFSVGKRKRLKLFGPRFYPHPVEEFSHLEIITFHVFQRTKVFVGSLPPGSKPEDLRRLFEKYGVVTECDIMNRCGFVHMQTQDMADNAIKNLNNSLFNGANIVVERGRMKERKPQGNGPQGGGGPPGRMNNNRNDGAPNRQGPGVPMGRGPMGNNGAFRGGNNGSMNQGAGMIGGNMQPNQMQGGGGPGPMRQNRQNDRQQNRNTPYKNQQNNNGGGNRGSGNFQRRNNDNGMSNNSSPGMNRFDNSMPMDNRQSNGMNNFDRGMNSNNMMDRRGGGGGGGGAFDNDNNFGFGEDRRGFALPSFPNDMGQNNFGNNDRQNNSGGMGNRRNNGEPN